MEQSSQERKHNYGVGKCSLKYVYLHQLFNSKRKQNTYYYIDYSV